MGRHVPSLCDRAPCAIEHRGQSSDVMIFRALENRLMRSFLMVILAGTFSMAAIGGAQAQSGDTRIASMPFGECLSIISEAAQEMDEEPVKLVNTSDVVTARIQASDGFVTVSCD